MILDSSALVAVFLQEPHHEALLEKLEVAPTRGIGAPTLAEAGIVLTARMRRNSVTTTGRRPSTPSTGTVADDTVPRSTSATA